MSAYDDTKDAFDPREYDLPGLPKWAQMRVMGAPLAPDLALEIIRRTDCFFAPLSWGGNNRAWSRFVSRMTGIPREPDARDFDDRFAWTQAMRVFRCVWGHIPTRFVRSDFIATSHLWGVNGFVHPDGTVHAERNIGKYPSAIAVLRDWETIAAAFPQIDCEVLLMGDETSTLSGETVGAPAIGFVVRDGTVAVHAPDAYPFFARFGGFSSRIEDARALVVARLEGHRDGYLAERAIPAETIVAWGRRHAQAGILAKSVYRRLRRALQRDRIERRASVREPFAVSPSGTDGRIPTPSVLISVSPKSNQRIDA